PAPSPFGDAIPLPGSAPAPSPFGDAIPLPGSAHTSAPIGAAIPLPGWSEPAPSFSGAAIPLPGSATSSAIPLPGLTATAATSADVGGLGDPFSDFGGEDSFSPNGQRWEDQSTRVAEFPVPQEAFPDQWNDDEDATRATGFTVPPEAFGDVPIAAADDFTFADPPAASGSAIPLPGSASQPFDFSDDFGAGSSPSDAIPLPGSDASQPWDDFGESKPGGAIELPPPDDFFAASPPAGSSETDFSFDVAPPAPPAPSIDFDLLPSPASPGASIAPPPPETDFSLDFDALPPAPAAASAPVPAWAPPPEPAARNDFSLDFDDLPSPAGSPPAPAPAAAPAGVSDDFSFDFADLPPAPAPAPAPAASEPDPFGDDFADLPSPADPYAQAPTPAAPPPVVDVSGSFGEIDFGEPPPPADDLEFDPMRSTRPVDDLEADLSSPLPPPPAAPQTADGLEMLSFIDDTAKEVDPGKSQKVKRFHVRRRSGKVFGPFEEGVIVKMLEDGQLLGNEDVSPDGDSWNAIGTAPVFHEAIQRLMEAPVPSTGLSDAAESFSTQHKANAAQSMERLKNLYEGRMAAVSVVDRKSEAEKVRKKLPLFIAAGLVVLIGAAGGSLAFTRYGAFGIKALLPATVSPGTPQFTQLQKAREAILADTYKSYTEARDLAQKLLAAKEYPEARAVWGQAVFYLERRYAAAKPAELSKARAELENIQLLGEKHPEFVKVSANAALNGNRPDEARLLLEDAVIRHDQDPELKLLLAEAYLQRAQDDRAAQMLERVLAKHPKSAKALHALGTLSRRKAEKLGNAGQREEANKEAEKAAELYAKAIEADPNHVISAVELAAIELLVHRDSTAGATALERALDEKSKQLMGPAELARARALNGVALTAKFKMKEAVTEFEEALKLDKDSVFAQAQLGRIYLSQREFEKAVPLFKVSSEKEPSNLDYVDGYLTVLIGNGKMQDALDVLKKANAQFPDTPRLAYLEARVNDALDKRTEAVSHYERAIKGDPSLFEASLHLGRLYLRQKRVADARTQFEDALQKAPERAAVHAGMGELALAEKDVASARAAFEKAASLDPTLQDAQLGLSRVALMENRIEDAAAFIEKALGIDSRVKGGLLQKGIVLWRQGKVDEAVAALLEARKLEPNDPQISITLGAVLLEKGDLAQAESALIAALTLDPRSAEANFHRARAKSRRAEHTQAIEAMKAALESAPKRADYHYEMGVILRDAKKGNEAMEEWKIAIELDPQYADAMEALGQALLDRGEFEPAIEQFEHALQVDPSRARLLGLIGDAWFQATQWDKAISRYESALKVDPSLTYVFYKIGRALSESGDPGKAITWYRKATEAEPKNAMPWYFLGFLHKERRQRPQAITAFQTYLELRPDAPDKEEIELEIYDLQQGI
ncbi:MAG: tetratricopeptide repeat protein, partial [Myxococcaceae bacterium]